MDVLQGFCAANVEVLEGNDDERWHWYAGASAPA